jgi:hypothetical protein
VSLLETVLEGVVGTSVGDGETGDADSVGVPAGV